MPAFSPGAFGAEAVPRVLLAVTFVAEEAVCLGALGQCVQKCFSLDNNPRSMTCRSGVVSVAIVVRTARTTASVLTPEPIALRARTGRSGRAVYYPAQGRTARGRSPHLACHCHAVSAACSVGWAAVPTDHSSGQRCWLCAGGVGGWCGCCPWDPCGHPCGGWRSGQSACTCSACDLVRPNPRSRIGCAFMDRLFACG